MARRKKTQRRPQSSELAAGAGFTFEDAVGGYFLAALLGEGYAPGIEDCAVSGVSFQQRNFGEPLDDVIVDFRDAAGGPARLSLQVKRRLRISSATSNTDFREVIRDCWLTFKKPDFRSGVDRYGAAVGDIAVGKARAFTFLGEMARESTTVDHFSARFARGGGASAAVKRVRKDVSAILKSANGAACSDADLHEFLRHLVLLQFDFLHDGAADPPAVMTRLRGCLATGEAAQAPLLWASLRQRARESGAVSGQFDRPRLVKELSSVVSLRAATSLLGDLDKLTALARAWASDITSDVGGVELERKDVAARLDDLLKTARFLQIRGLPGCGKSVVLRQRLEAELTRGPALFLKADRLEGKGWNSFAVANGLSGAALASLLVEIGSTGSRTLFIDGIDRIEKEHQPIVRDVLKTIVDSPLLSDWKVVVSVRDTGIEPLRNWLGDVLDALGIAALEVSALDDNEAEVLAQAKPQLRALLFGPPSVREIVRRPFFVKILNQALASGGAESLFRPQSEIDLIEHWWARGGYNATGQGALERQRAIIDVGGRQARQPSQSVPLKQLSGSTLSMLDQLCADGIVRQVRPGHTARFAHDIYFEWAYFHVLADRGGDWLTEVKECGEPPAVARAVELLSQAEYLASTTWAETLQRTATSRMRPQWTRSWLLGPVAMPTFAENSEQFADAVMANDCHLLKRALVWFQAEKTTPNPQILAGELPPDERARVAYLLGWPSDFSAWRRLIGFLLSRVEVMPVASFPDVVEVFEVWQNALAGVENPISVALLTQCAVWLREIDGENNAKTPTDKTRWGGLEEFGDFRQSLTRLIFRSAGTMPQLTEEYLRRLLALEDRRDERFKEVLDFSAILSRTHSEVLVELTLKHLLDELPDEKMASERRRSRATADARRKTLAKPEAERTRRDNMIIAGGMSPLSYQQFSYHDFDRLSVEYGSGTFSPASPLRAPFHSLFRFSPNQALRLLKTLCNHAITAWQQLHRHVHDTPGTPIPLSLEFPWGVQRFWGGSREYLWCRGQHAPGALECAFMALEEWCFAELERGRPTDDLIHQIVEGNQCIAILGVAVTLALQTERVSETVFPLVTAQRLWVADHGRAIYDMSSSGAALIGFGDRADRPHFDAVAAANARPVRKLQLSDLAFRYVFSPEFSDRARDAVLHFKDALPYEIEEWQNDPETRARLEAQAIEYTELAVRENYRARKVPDREGLLEIMHVSPSAQRPENVARAKEATVYLQQTGLWTWASKAFEAGKMDDQAKFAQAIELARQRDDLSLFEGPESRHGEGTGIRRGAVAATAALVLTHREGRAGDDMEWARDAIVRAYTTTEDRDLMWHPQAVIPWHQGIFVARGLAAELSHGSGDSETAIALLALVTHPLEQVSLTALEQAAVLAHQDPKLAWAALSLALDLCRVEPVQQSAQRGPGELIHTPRRVQDAANSAMEYYKSGAGWPDLPLPPPAWVKAEASAEARRFRRHDLDDDDLENPGERWIEPPTHWYSQYSAKVMTRVPYEQLLAGGARNPLLGFMSGVLEWTNAKNSPPWLKKGRRDRESSRLYEWTHELGGTLGRISGVLPLAEVQSRFLTPIFELEGDACWALLSPFVSGYICRYVYDAEKMPESAIDVLGLCLDRFLRSSSFKRSSYRSGEFYGFDEPRLLQSLMFVSVERADMAARYVNGDWSELALILPLIDRLVRAGGWSATVMGQFLTFCERSKTAYPAGVFAEQVLTVIGDGSEVPRGWRGTFIPARIAGLIQFFAVRDTPMSMELGQALLRVLDLLVDMGDRRSAALQLGESFREIRIA